MEATSIELIAFATEAEKKRLSSILSSFQVPFEIKDSQGWLRRVTRAGRVIELLLLEGGQFDQELLERKLEEDHSMIRMSALCRLGTGEHRRLAELSDEFLLWPEGSGELHLRLSRLAERLAPAFATGAASQGLEGFVELSLIGRSPQFVEILNLVKKVARIDAPALIEGETGTGKELVARAIHYLGPRGEYPFVPVNCGSLPDNLIENELFGHRRGAYTDAREDHPGLVALADGGTLFLDEIETLSEKGQVTLLRFLQDKEFKPLGARNSKKVDIRVIAASNAPMPNLVKGGGFRQDLFFRLNVVPLDLPPLRDRQGDVAVLAHYFVDKYRKIYDQPEKILSARTLEVMKRYSWPGNVREMENAIQRAFVLGDNKNILVENHISVSKERREAVFDRRISRHFNLELKEAKSQVVEDFERSYLRWLMEESGGNVTRAARKAGKERRALGKLLKKYALR